jgi:hypothetical protein
MFHVKHLCYLFAGKGFTPKKGRISPLRWRRQLSTGAARRSFLEELVAEHETNILAETSMRFQTSHLIKMRAMTAGSAGAMQPGGLKIMTQAILPVLFSGPC